MKTKTTIESKVREIKRTTRRKFSAEEKIRIVLEVLRAEDSLAAICRRDGIHPTCIAIGAKSSWKPAKND